VPSYLWKKKMLFTQSAVVAATFLDFQANIFPLLFNPRDRKFPKGISDKAVLMVYFLFDLTLFLGVRGFYIS
jgi:hypothetical protein